MTEALTVLQWSRLSDQVGRKPIMILGLFGSSVSILSFGLSRTFLWLVIRYLTAVILDLTRILSETEKVDVSAGF